MMTKQFAVTFVLGTLLIGQAPFAFAQDMVQPTTVTIPPVTPVPPYPIFLCPFDTLPVLQRGSRGDAVKQLQKMLGLPADSQTGFYGTITEGEVKKVEEQYGFPKSGIVDNDLRPIFFPCYQIAVMSPNGGETWYGGQTYEVSWAIETPYFYPLPLLPESRPVPTPQSGATPPRAGVKELKKGEAEANASFTPPGQFIRPVPSYLSVDLVQYGNVIVHIGAADIYGGTQSLSWTVPKHLLSGAYRVRVSVAGSPVYYDLPAVQENAMYPLPWRGFRWDESDADFRIVNDVTPPPSNPKLKEQMIQLLKMLEEMQRLVLEMIASL